MKHIELKIKGMTCDGCATTIIKHFEGKAGIRKINISYPKGKGWFTFDEKIISAEEIIRTIHLSGHYRVVSEEKSAPRKTEHSETFDLIIIGGGSAAFSAAIKAENLGISTLMVNAGLPFGGTCVNVGCIPSKTIIRAAETVYHTAHPAFKGISSQRANLNFAEIMKEKTDLVATLQQKKYMDVVRDFQHLKLIEGWAEFVDEKTIRVNGDKTYKGMKFIIATGAKTHIPQIEGLKEAGFFTHVSLFNLKEKPKSMTILGAGYIGCEIAMAYHRLGVKVRIMQFTDRVLRSQTPDVGKELQKHMLREGIELLPNVRAYKFERQGNKTFIHVKNPDGTTACLTEPGIVFVATGITANTRNLKPESIGLQLAPNGRIAVNERMETNISHIYAAGDVADTPSYVYTAAFEGKIAVENAFTEKNITTDYSSLPWVIFTDPQVAGTGMDELQAEKQNIPYEVSKLSLKDIPRALAAHDTRGFIKLIRNSKTDRLIGARIIAPEGGELIQTLSMAIKYGITVTELSENLYPYLTLSEGIKLAAIAFEKDVSTLSCCAS